MKSRATNPQEMDYLTKLQRRPQKSAKFESDEEKPLHRAAKRHHPSRVMRDVERAIKSNDFDSIAELDDYEME